MTELLPDRALLRVTGVDAMPFLQNLVTNDVSSEGLVYACLLTPQGRFLHDLFILRDGDGYLVEGDAMRRDDLMRRLTVYKLRSKVTIEKEDALHVHVSRGSGLKDPRHADIGFRQYLPAAATAGKDYRDRLIALGIPEGVDMKPEIDTVTDLNLDQLNAVSWTKGCYVGQEVTARMNNRGLAKKRMMIVTGEGLTPGAQLSQSGYGVGEVRAVDSAGLRGLAILKISVLTDNVSLTDANGRVLLVIQPAWLQI